MHHSTDLARVRHPLVQLFHNSMSQYLLQIIEHDVIHVMHDACDKYQNMHADMEESLKLEPKNSLDCPNIVKLSNVSCTIICLIL